LLNKPESEYTTKCMDAWKPYNEARCWCFTGCALDCTHEPNAPDGIPGVPGLDIHPHWCRPSKRSTVEDCHDLTCAVEAACADEPNVDDIPGIGFLTLTGGYNCTKKEEKKIPTTAFDESGIVCTAQDAAAQLFGGAFDWNVTLATIGSWEFPTSTSARYNFEEDCGQTNHPMQEGRATTTFNIGGETDMQLQLSGMGEAYYETMTIVLDGKTVTSFTAQDNGDNFVKTCDGYSIVTVANPDVSVKLTKGTHTLDLHVTTKDGVANFGYFQMAFAIDVEDGELQIDPACPATATATYKAKLAATASTLLAEATREEYAAVQKMRKA
jgi:hypothetical protein